MAGIYLHIPFCKKACHYCNFHFSTSTGLKNDFVEALRREIAMRSAGSTLVAPYLGDEIIETIYFGGGTPSLLSLDELQAITDALANHFNIDSNAEITFEANPDDISEQKLQEWKKAGINRLSIGVQSFFDDDLAWMNRAHRSAQSLDAILAAQQAGFQNITIDLIYGTPFLTHDRWKYNLDRAIETGVPHLSCYALTVEPATALDKMIKQHKSPDVDPEKQAEQFMIMTERLDTAGFEHYEISNFAQPGMRSRHNSSYWQGKKYLGLGPSAHSFNGSSRQWNIANNALYIKSIEQSILPVEVENLTTTQQLNEYVMTSIRTMEGLDFEHIKATFGAGAVQHLTDGLQQFIIEEKVVRNNQRYSLTRTGKLFADGIAGSLFK